MSNETGPTTEKLEELEELISRNHKFAANFRYNPFTSWDWLAEKHPEYLKVWQPYEEFVHAPEAPALPVKYRELIVSAILAFRHYPTTDVHLRRAMDAGATLREVLEAMEVASIPGGSPTLDFALNALVAMNLDDEDQADHQGEGSGSANG